MPDPTVMAQLTDDLILSGDFIDSLEFSKRVPNALEAIAEFGTVDQLPALERFESDVTAGAKKAAVILTRDLNRNNLLFLIGEWRKAAGNARAAIKKRAGNAP